MNPKNQSEAEKRAWLIASTAHGFLVSKSKRFALTSVMELHYRAELLVQSPFFLYEVDLFCLFVFETFIDKSLDSFLTFFVDFFLFVCLKSFPFGKEKNIWSWS